MDMTGWLKRAVLFSPLLAAFIVLILCFIWPDIFWDGFVFKYYWSPIVADAGGDSGGATSEYNWVDTTTYGLILALSAFYINRLFVKKGMRVGLPFFASMFPVIIIGSSARVLEDMELFNEPLQYLFISPIIYIMLGVLTLLSILLSERIERKWPHGGRDQRAASALVVILPSLIVALVITGFKGCLNQAIPVMPVLLIGFAMVLPVVLNRGCIRWERSVFLIWTEVVLVIVYLYVLWLGKGDWYDRYVSMNFDVAPEIHLGAGGFVILLSLASTAIVGALVYLALQRSGNARRILSGVNALILGGHMLDASATYIGIERFGYTEKHVLPSMLIDLTGSALVMYPLKLFFLIPALYVLDHELMKEAAERPHMMALVKLTVLILGMAPGTRDLIRLALGV